MDPCQPATGIAQRYHDGATWTRYVSDLWGSTWGRIEERPYTPPPAPDGRYAFLPHPARIPLFPPEPPTRGWWTDPYRPGPNPRKPGYLAPGPLCQRFHDGGRWTPYISYRMPGARQRKRIFTVQQPNVWSGITEDPGPLAQPAPKLDIGRSIDDYSFLPRTLSGDDPPEHPTMGWWKDPFRDFGQRFHDGTRWTQYSEFWSSKMGEHLLETPPVPYHRPPAVEYNPGPLRTGRSFGAAMAAVFSGLVLLLLSVGFDHPGTLSDWIARTGLLSFVAGFGALSVHVVRMAFPPKSLGRTDITNALYAAVLMLLFGAGLVALRDPVLRALWLR
jgi:hypothetical protein